MQFDRLLDQVTSFMEKEARTETVIGKAFKLGNYDCIPEAHTDAYYGDTVIVA